MNTTCLKNCLSNLCSCNIFQKTNTTADTPPPSPYSLESNHSNHSNHLNRQYHSSSSSSEEIYDVILNTNSITNSTTHTHTKYMFKKIRSQYTPYYLNICYHSHNITDEGNKIVIFDHHGGDNNKLPLRGWLHHCLCCNSITGSDVFFCMYRNINIHIQFCNRCVYHNNLEKFKETSDIISEIKIVLRRIDFQNIDDI